MICPNCAGKGTWRRQWNEVKWYGYDGAQSSTVNRFCDEVCPRCEGAGEVPPMHDAAREAA